MVIKDNTQITDVHDDVSQAFWNYSALLGSNIGVACLSFVNAFLLIRWLGPEGYGKLALFLSVSSAMLILGTNWTMVALVRIGCEEFVQTGKINRSFWGRTLFLVLTLILLSLGCYLFRNYLNKYVSIPEWGIWLILGYLAVSAFSLHVQHALQAAKRLKQLGLVQLVGKAVITIGLVVALVLLQINLISAIGAFIIGGCFGIFAFFLLIDRSILVPVKIDLGIIKDLFLFSYPLVLSYWSGFFAGGYFDTLILNKFLSTKEVGIYYLANQMSGLISQVPTVAGTMLLPMLTTFYATGRKDLINRYLLRLLPQGVFLWSIVICFMMFVGQYMLPMIFGTQFESAVIPFGILLLSSSIASINWLAYGSIINVYKWTKLASLIVVVSGTVNLISDLVLIPLLGIIGCAVATLTNYMVAIVLIMLLVNRRLQINNYQTFFAVSPSIVILLGICLKQPFLALVAMVVSSYSLIKLLNFFDQGDIDIVTNVSMPSFLKRLLLKIYMGKKNEKTILS